MGPEGGSGAIPKVMVEMLLGLWSHPQSDGGDVVGQDGARKGPITRRSKRGKINKKRRFQEMRKWPNVLSETAIFDF